MTPIRTAIPCACYSIRPEKTSIFWQENEHLFLCRNEKLRQVVGDRVGLAADAVRQRGLHELTDVAVKHI